MAKILVVENESEQRHLMCRFLERRGHKGVEAGNGMEAMTTLARTAVDAVVCDLVMPVQDGIDTIKKIRVLDTDIPIVAISGFSGPDDVSLLDRALEVGADRVLRKPFGMEKFLATVDDALAGGKLS